MSTPRDAQELFDPDARKPDGTEGFLDTPARTNDPKALKEKALSDKQRELKAENDLKEILARESGVRFVARVLKDFCGYDLPYWCPNYGEMSNIAGRRQVGGQIIEAVKNCDLGFWFKVERELENLRVKPKTSTKQG